MSREHRVPHAGLRLHHRLASLRMTLGVLASGILLCLALAAPALAESPWWHLTSGSRPTYIDPNASKPGIPGQPEVQEILVPLEEGLGGFELGAGSIPTGNHCFGSSRCFVYPESFAIELEPPFIPLTKAKLEATLETVYGAGKVTVSEPQVVGEVLSFEVTHPVGNSITVNAIEGLRQPEVRLAQSGVAEIPAVYDGEIYVTAENVGDGAVDGAKTKVQFKDVLPKGLKATGIIATKPFKEAEFLQREPIACVNQTLTCTLEEGLAPYDQIEMRITVEVEAGASSGDQNEVSISGGGAPASSLKRPITISSSPVPFGVESYEMDLEEEGGKASSQAGVHPFQLNTTIDLNQLADLTPARPLPEVTVPALAKDLSFRLPPGLIGNPTAIPQCTITQFFEIPPGGKENRCPADTAVGVATATVHEPTQFGTITVTEPVFNVEPRVGEPARFGFYVVQANSPVLIDTAVRTGSDYGVTVNVQNITQTAAFLSSEVTFWGVPGDPRHDNQRGWSCLFEARGFHENPTPCAPSGQQHPPPFLSLPTNCTSAMATSVHGDSWSAPGDFFDFTGAFEPAAPLGGCNRLQFAPEIKVAPDSQEASKPSGLTVDVHVPQEVNNNAQGLASSNVKTITVAFPQGVTLNPSAADGLQACSEEQVGLLPGLGAQEELLFTPTLPQAFCPTASKIGTVRIKSPLLPAGQPIEGALYLANPAPNGEGGRNPFNSLLAMYIIAEDPVSGTLVKLPGRATLDQGTGQITSTFDNNPQLAFEDAEIHLFGGERAPLATPSHCGTYTTNATFTPWSGTEAIKSSSSFQITTGPNGSSCPPAALPFNPSLAAGSTNNNAGSFSPLTTTLNREDGNQQIQAVSLHLAPGLSGILKGVELCSEAQANAGTCGSNSLIGHTVVSVGIGGDPFSVTGGQVFLTAGYKGAPFGLSIVNPAVAGPFDLGKVIVRAKVEVDPHTAQLTVTTDEAGPYAIPHILDGIPLQIKHVNVLIDRPGFTFNPTSCNPQAITGTIQSDEGAQASVSTPFQATNCASLKFAPKFSVSTAGETSKQNGASLSVKLTYPKAPAGTYANVAKVKVSLPKQLPSRLTTIQKACTSQAFDQNPANCPADSILGQAKVLTQLLPVPLTGPAYFVSHAAEAFPDLTIVLKGYGVTVVLIGNTQIKNGITTTTFKATPDVPFESFELSLPEGPHSALAANANLCKSKLTMPTEFTAQNGSVFTQQTKIAVTGCPKSLTRAQRLKKALKACHKKRDGRRTACERKARKRFGAKKGSGGKK